MNKAYEINDDQLNMAAGGRFVGDDSEKAAEYVLDEYCEYLSTQNLSLSAHFDRLDKANKLHNAWDTDDKDHTFEEFRDELYEIN